MTSLSLSLISYPRALSPSLCPNLSHSYPFHFPPLSLSFISHSVSFLLSLSSLCLPSFLPLSLSLAICLKVKIRLQIKLISHSSNSLSSLQMAKKLFTKLSLKENLKVNQVPTNEKLLLRYLLELSIIAMVEEGRCLRAYQLGLFCNMLCSFKCALCCCFLRRTYCTTGCPDFNIRYFRGEILGQNETYFWSKLDFSGQKFVSSIRSLQMVSV